MELTLAILIVQIILFFLFIVILVFLIRLYKNVMKFLRLWDRFYGNHWLYGTPDFEN